MRNIINIGFILCVLISVLSCKDTDSTYRDFLVPGGVKYPQKASKVFAYSGKSQVKIEWARGADASVSKAIVYWDNFTASKEVAISPEDENVSVIIPDLVEKDYSFIIKTFDVFGNVSVPVEVNGKAYGDIYQSSIFNRTLEVAYLNDGKLLLEWGGADVINGMQKTVITYKTVDGTKTIDLKVDEYKNTIDDYVEGSEISFVSTYKPDSTCLDIFSSEVKTTTPFVWREGVAIERTDWKMVASHTHSGATGQPSVGNLLMDGDAYRGDNSRNLTYWHSDHKNTGQIWLSVDMGKPINITKLIITSRKFDDWHITKIASFTLQGSNDGSTWTDIASYNVAEEDAGPQLLPFKVITPYYYSAFRMIMNPAGDYISFAELNIEGIVQSDN